MRPYLSFYLLSAGFSLALSRVFCVAVMPLDTASKAAVEGFLRTRRDGRPLREESIEKLLAYFAGKGTSLAELPTVWQPQHRRGRRRGAPADERGRGEASGHARAHAAS